MIQEGDKKKKSEGKKVCSWKEEYEHRHEAGKDRALRGQLVFFKYVRYTWTV